jgi:hypothetical protein
LGCSSSAPAFTLSPSTISATTGVSITGYTVSSTGGTIASYSISPSISNTPGLSFSTSTGLISGVPTTAAASRTYSVTATNATNSATRDFAITVSAPSPPYVAPVPVPYLKTLTTPKRWQVHLYAWHIQRRLHLRWCSSGKHHNFFHTEYLYLQPLDKWSRTNITVSNFFNGISNLEPSHFN